jgi:hypothetical protein
MRRPTAPAAAAATRIIEAAVQRGRFDMATLQSLRGDGRRLNTDALPMHGGLDQYKTALGLLLHEGLDHGVVIARIDRLLRSGRSQQIVREDATSAAQAELHVFEGDLDFSNEKQGVFPEGLTHLRGSLNLAHNKKITQLPRTLMRVAGNLNVASSQVQELPPALTHIGGSLYANDSEVRGLPAALTRIGGSLHLYDSEVRELPATLTHIGHSLYAYNSPVRELPAALTYIGGDLSLHGSQVRELPASLTYIGRNLVISDSQVRELPASLTCIGGDLLLGENSRAQLPANIDSIVKGRIIRK